MGFEQNFRVLEEIPAPLEGQDQEVLGREISSGRPVVVHFLAAKTGPEQTAFLRKLLSLGAERSHYVLESGTFKGRAYIVTKVLPEHVSLRAWVAQSIGSVGVDFSSAPAPPPVSAGGPGEFTLQFQAPKPASGQDVPAEDADATQVFRMPPMAAQPAKPSVPVNPPANEPGEFTRLFQAAPPDFQTPAPASAPPAVAVNEPGESTKQLQSPSGRGAPPAPAPEPAVSEVSKGPGEFTQMFQTVPRPVPSAPTEPAGRNEPGEFTRGFRHALSTPPESAKPVAAESQPGDFTRMFQTVPQQIPSVPPHEPAMASEPGEFTREFRHAPPAEARPAEPSAQFPSAPYESAVGSAPGEFTRMFQTPPGPASPPAAPSAVLASPVPKDHGWPRTPEPAVKQPGEFTRMFHTPPPAAPPPVSTPHADAPGEFTRLLQQDSPAAPAQIPPPASGPGEFTSRFSAPVTSPQAGPGEATALFPAGAFPAAGLPPATFSGASAPSERAAPGSFTQMLETASARPAASAPPGDFTQQFGVPKTPPMPPSALPAPSQTAPPPPLPAATGSPGAFTQMFSSPYSAPPPIAPSPAPALPSASPKKTGATGAFAVPTQPSVPQAPPAGPGRYTREFATPSVPPPLSVETVSAAAPKIELPKVAIPALKVGPNYMPLIIGLGGLLLVALLVVILFAVRG